MDTYQHIINTPPDELFNLSQKFLSNNSTDDYYIHLIMAANLNHQPAINFIIGIFGTNKYPLKFITQPILNFLKYTQNYMYSSTFLARAYRDNKVYDKAIELFQPGVEANCPIALHCLAYMYERGLGTNVDYRKAIELYELAAVQNYSSSIYNLALLYALGQGVVRDYAKAAELFELAIKYGDSDAIINLGILYHNGEGVVQDFVKAVELFTTAVSHGNINAMRNLASMYEHGRGVQLDLSEAERLYKLSYESGNKTALNDIIFLYRMNLDKFEPEKIVAYIMERAPDKLSKIFPDRNACIVLQKWYHNEKKIVDMQKLLDDQIEINRQLMEHINLSPGGPEYLELLRGWNTKVGQINYSIDLSN